MKNASEIIDFLGGTAVVSKIFGVSSAAVSKWRRIGIPPARLMYLEVKYPKVFKKLECKNEQ